MAVKHAHRRIHIFGVKGIRAKLWRLGALRTHANFTALLSGYDGNGSPDGPYAGVRVLGQAKPPFPWWPRWPWPPLPKWPYVCWPWRPWPLFRSERHEANDDEDNRLDKAGNYSKGLLHTDLNDAAAPGFVDPAQYGSFVQRLDTARSSAGSTSVLPDPASVAEIDAIPNIPPRERSFVNPLGGLAADVVGLDPYEVTIPPAPALTSEIAAAETIELYWMALLRDVPFNDWDTHPDAAAAIADLNVLNAALPQPFVQHRISGAWSNTIDLQTLFRGSAPGNEAGPYVSQFLLLDVPFGTLDLAQRQVPLKEPERDYMIDPAEWLRIQDGERWNAQATTAEPGRADLEVDNNGKTLPPCVPPRRHIVTLRELAHYVHFDALHEAYFNAALILGNLMPPAPLSAVNVYQLELPPGSGQPRMMKHQRGFGTFGGPHILVLLTEVATRALKAVWHQKWYVHRRLRPEAMGARVHAARRANNPIQNLVHAHLLGSDAVNRIRQKNQAAGFDTYLLPMAFPEGSPMHPSYGAGHATVAGACVTVLKALFDPTHPLPEVTATIDSNGETSLNIAATNSLTVEGELNKLAANIAIGRNAAGVHYRSDYTKSLALGEAVAVAMLQEMAITFVEAEAGLPIWRLPTFRGDWIAIDAAGALSRVAPPPPPPPLAPGAEPRPTLFSA